MERMEIMRLTPDKVSVFIYGHFLWDLMEMLFLITIFMFMSAGSTVYILIRRNKLGQI